MCSVIVRFEWALWGHVPDTTRTMDASSFRATTQPRARTGVSHRSDAGCRYHYCSNLLLGRIASKTWPIVADVSWSVCRCVCLCWSGPRDLAVGSAKADEPIEMAFVMWTRARETISEMGRIHPTGRGTLKVWGGIRPIEKPGKSAGYPRAVIPAK